MDGDGALLKDGLGQMRGGVAPGAPGRSCQDPVRGAFHRPDLPAGVLNLDAAVVQELAQELLDIGSIDPRRTHARVDLSRRQVRRDHRAQLGDVDGEPRVLRGGRPGLPELDADLAGQVLSSRD